jgi:MYXO-CTERM domain-containing protein
LAASLAAFCLTFGAGKSAFASETFPEEITKYLETQGSKVAPVCPVGCILCHTTPNGGEGTSRPEGFVVTLGAQSELGYVMRMSMGPAPFQMGRPETVGPALKDLETLPCPGTSAPCDTDKDGMDDVAELRLGRNPDGAGDLADCPKYGCGASVAPVRPTARHVHGALAVGLLGLAAFLARRRR